VTFEPFDVIVVPFPFTDRQVAKRRPTLVVSSAEFNRDHDQTILAMITSSTRDAWPSDVVLTNWQEAGLVIACRVRLKLFTLDNALVLRRLGTLTERDATAVTQALVRSLAIA